MDTLFKLALASFFITAAIILSQSDIIRRTVVDGSVMFYYSETVD